MKFLCASTAAIVMSFGSGAAALAQGSPDATAQSASAPAVMRIDGELKSTTGEPRTGSVLLVASVYATQADPTPLWLEQQVVTLDAAGRYTIVVGSTLTDGMPKELFTSGAARWLGVGVQGETEQPRVMFVSVPYAMKA